MLSVGRRNETGESILMDWARVVRVFDAIYAAQAASPAHKEIFREVYGDEYPEEVEPLGYTDARDLRRIATALNVGRGHTFIDLGCGRGGLGLWIARQTGSSLIGIDLSPAGVREARRRRSQFVPVEQASFEVGDLLHLRFADATFDAAMSIAVIWMIPEPARLLAEVARILKRGARFAFTDWDRDLSPPGAPPPILDHRPLLDDAGFEVLAYEVIPDAEAKRRRVYELYIEREMTLRDEMGPGAVEALLFEAKRALGVLDGRDYLAHSRQVFVVAERNA
jgi:ubiquinone/menaquinone biosynthesis C-methylase UbiE